MNKLISILLLVCLAWLPLHADAIIVGYGNTPVGGGGFTAFTDDFTGADYTALNSTHWNSSSATIFTNKASFGPASTTITAQGKEEITLQQTHSIKADIDDSQALASIVDTAYTAGRIIVQDSASVGGNNNKVYAELRFDCTDGDGQTCYSYTMIASLVSTSGAGTPTTLWSGPCSNSETAVEIRFDNSLTNVRLYINGTAKDTQSRAITGTLGSTVKVAMQAQSNTTGIIEVFFDNFTVSVL